MTLDVETPAPPDLSNRNFPSTLDPTDAIESESDLRREELEGFLREGAWNEAFNEWAEYTDFTETEFRIIRDHGLIEQLDFFWDPVDERLRFSVPPLPNEWSPQDDIATLTKTELMDLGQTVVEMLEAAYVDWGEQAVIDNSWREESLDEESTRQE